MVGAEVGISRIASRVQCADVGLPQHPALDPRHGEVLAVEAALLAGPYMQQPDILRTSLAVTLVPKSIFCGVASALRPIRRLKNGMT